MGAASRSELFGRQLAEESHPAAVRYQNQHRLCPVVVWHRMNSRQTKRELNGTKMEQMGKVLSVVVSQSHSRMVQSGRGARPEMRHPLPRTRPPHHTVLFVQRHPRVVSRQNPAKVRIAHRSLESAERQEPRRRALPRNSKEGPPPRWLRLPSRRAGRIGPHPAHHRDLSLPGAVQPAARALCEEP
jgi:hypothetical protein